jgi:DNA-binding SARP family transcriptional activator
MKLRLNILGPFELHRDSGKNVPLSSKKAQALLAVLAISAGNRLSRESLVALLWADRGDEQARSSLRQALSALRKALCGDSGTGPLRTDDQSVGLAPEHIDCDLLEFRKACGQSDSEKLEAALKLYRGDLLEGLTIKEAAFQDWLEQARQALRKDLEGLLTRLSEIHESEGHLDKAIEAAKRLLQLDPYREGNHRALMRLFSKTGERSRALQQYQACYDLLKADLGIAPEQETRDLYQSLLGSHEKAAASENQDKQVPSPAIDPPKKVRRRPTFAVLPFESIGGDSELSHLADDITREVINEVGRFSLITVIGAATIFSFRNRNADILEVGRELDVDFILEGALRSRGGRLRITSQLTDLETDRQIWGDRFESDLGQGFEEIDALVRRISGNLFQPLMRRASLKARSLAGEDRNIGNLFLQAYHNIERPTLEGNEEARRLCNEIIALDPEFPLVYELLSWVDIHAASNGWGEDPWAALHEARQSALRGVALNERDGYPRSALGFIEVILGNFARGCEELDTAVTLNPNDCEFWTFQGAGLGLAGKYLEALASLDEARRLSPGYPPTDLFRGNAHLVAGKFAEALACYDRLLAVLNEYGWAVTCRAVCLVELGNLQEARQSIESLERESPHLSCSYMENLLQAQDPAFRERMVKNLRRAGLRERAG